MHMHLFMQLHRALNLIQVVKVVLLHAITGSFKHGITL